MEVCINPRKEEWSSLCERAVQGSAVIEERVYDILKRVRRDGDTAIRELAAEIDGVNLDGIKVTPREMEEACQEVGQDVKDAIERAYANIFAFHKAEMPERIEVETMPGVRCIQKPVAIESVGMYIPGGTAPLFSTVLMLAIPSLIAGCRTRILCTPVGKNGKVNPEVLYAASRCGISEVFKAGGAQAIGAMAYGTESVPKVDKIFGPGNRYVTTAKQIVATQGTAIDMPAGPSEVMVLADAAANPAFVAADLLSQAEHGRDSQVILVCTEEDFARRTLAEVDRQASMLPRGEMISSSLDNSRAVVFKDIDTMLEFADAYAPEHLIISMEGADELAERIQCAGSIFVGEFSPESAGDYASGTNHTLPTAGWARSYSGVNIDSFIRKTTIQSLSASGLRSLGGCITTMAEAEGLYAHANAVKVRLESVQDAPETGFRPEDFARSNILNLSPYSTARDEYQGDLGIFLDANENPFQNGYNRYPDPRQKALKARIGELKGYPVENIFLGNGSDEAIDLMFRIFCEPGRDNAVAICPSYGMYKVSAAINNIELREVLLKEDFQLDSGAILAATDTFTKLIFLCSPNNPSGNAFKKEEILALADSFRGILVVDEAYIDFSDKGSLVLCRPDIVVLQTLSKAWGLAALRIGLAIADERIIRMMNMVKYPYNISKAAQETAMRMLEESAGKRVDAIRQQRDRLLRELPSIPAVRKVWPSDANFILVRFDDADSVYDTLIKAGIIVRNRSRVPLCEGCLRITVGTAEENDNLINTLKRL